MEKVILNLSGLDGNAYSLIEAFRANAKKQGWSKEAIDKVITDCKSSDYNHLLCVLMDNIEEED